LFSTNLFLGRKEEKLYQQPFFGKESLTKETGLCFSFSTGFLFAKKKKCVLSICFPYIPLTRVIST